MTRVARDRRTAWRVMVLLLPWCLMLGQLGASEGDKTPQVISERPAPFVLTVHVGLISLRAQEASLKAIVEELGRQLNVEVVAQIPPEERVTLTFDRLSLEDAITQFRQYAKVVYLMDGSEKAQSQIIKILIFPKQTGIAGAGSDSLALDIQPGRGVRASERPESGASTSQESSHPGPFKFEFDPSQVMKQTR